MSAGELEPEAASAAANFLASVVANVMERRREAGDLMEPEMGEELNYDREDLDDTLLAHHDGIFLSSMSPTFSTPTCMEYRGDSRQMIDTPSTQIGLTPSPSGWHSQPSTSHSFGRGVVTPAPRAGTSLAMRSSSAMDYVRESHHEGKQEPSFRPSTSMDFVRESQHKATKEKFSQAPPEAFARSTPRTAPGARRPVLQRGSSFPLAGHSTQDLARSAPTVMPHRAQERETKEEYDQLTARLSARQFLSGIVLGKVLALGSSATALQPIHQRSEDLSSPVIENEERLTSGNVHLEDMPGIVAESEDVNKVEGATRSSSASHPPARGAAPSRGNNTVDVDKALENPQPEPPSSKPTSRPNHRYKTQPIARLTTVAAESSLQSARKRSLQEQPPAMTELRRRRASDGPPSPREVNSSSSARVNAPRSKASPAPPPPIAMPTNVKVKGKATQDTCSCGNVFVTDALFCFKCGSRRSQQTLQQRRSFVAPRTLKRKSSKKNQGQSDGPRSSAPSPEGDDEELSRTCSGASCNDFGIHGGTFGLLGVDAPDIHQFDSVVNHAMEYGCDGADAEMNEQWCPLDEYGNPLVLQESEISSEVQAPTDLVGTEEVEEDNWQKQLAHNHRVAFEQNQHEWAYAESINASQPYSDHGHTELSLEGFDPNSQVLTVGSCMPVGWASTNLYDSSDVVAEFGEYDTYGLQSSANLEASVSGQQLGHLLASSCGMNLFSSSPVTLTLDEQTVAAVYAAAGVSFEAIDHSQENQYESEMANAELAASEEEALLAAADSPIAEDELRRAQTYGRRAFRESTNAEHDLVVVKSKGSSRPAVAGQRSQSDQLSEEESLTRADSRSNTRSSLEYTATGLQVESVRLLEDLEGFRSHGASLNLYSKRPKSVGRVLDTSARMSPFGRAGGGAQKNKLQNRPNWNTSFTNIHERRIPRYDALVDGHCPVMTSPVRLKQVLQTRDVSSEYLHIVRSRFESHRKCFDPEHKLGDRSRPEPTAAQQMKLNNARMPATFLKRVTELQTGVGEGSDESGDHSLALGAEEQLRMAPSLASSSEWHDSPLYYQCLKDQKGDVADGLPSLTSPDDDVGFANEELPIRWERLRSRIEVLWRELMIPLDMRSEICDGPFKMAMTADSVYRLEMHQTELLEFRHATRRIINDCLEHDRILEAVHHSHALGVNDSRLSSLREYLVMLDRLGTSLVRAIGVWSRRFGHLVVDISKLSLPRSGIPKPRAVFVWKGHDMVERIQTVSDALSAGSPQLLADAMIEQDSQTRDVLMNAGAKVHGQRGAAGMKAKDKKAASATSPLVSLAMVSQKFSVNDVLHEGPPPTWYRPRIAKAGIAAIKRGTPCGGGDKRE